MAGSVTTSREPILSTKAPLNRVSARFTRARDVVTYGALGSAGCYLSNARIARAAARTRIARATDEYPRGARVARAAAQCPRGARVARAAVQCPRGARISNLFPIT